MKNNSSIAVGEFNGYWCIYCQRVSFPISTEYVYKCAYDDCTSNQSDYLPNILKDNKGEIGVQFVAGGLWRKLRLNYHPEYPELPTPGERYSMPELLEDVKPFPLNESHKQT